MRQVISQISSALIDTNRLAGLSRFIHADKHRIARMSITTDILFTLQCPL